MSSENNYRGIFKATTLIGGVQVINILISVIRNKVVSILLGPAGMGIMGLLQSTVNALYSISNCGLTSSALKNVSVAYEQKDPIALGRVVYVVKRLLWVTGVIAVIIGIAFSKQLSIWSFGNEDFTVPYRWLSISLLFTQLTNGSLLFIRCCRQLKMYAKANFWGNFSSLIVTVPLFFIWGVNAIVPALIIISVSTFVISFFFERKMNIKEHKVEKVGFKEISIDIFKIGIAVAFAGMLPDCLAYYLRIFMSSHGGVADVGYYAAGFAILNSYVGMIFTAMSTDYIPRLSAVVDDNAACQDTINKQVRIAAMFLLPILTLFIIFSRLLVRILYTEEFFPMIGMMMWGAVGCFIRSADWSMGNLFVPKRDTKEYLGINWLSAAISIGLNIYCYMLWGITGLGVALIFFHLSETVITAIYMKRRYGIVFEKDVIVINLLGSAFLILLVLINRLFTNFDFLHIIINSIMILAVCIYSYKNLNRYMGIDMISIIRNKIKSK